jgi:hypothetical protein
MSLLRNKITKHCQLVSTNGTDLRKVDYDKAAGNTVGNREQQIHRLGEYEVPTFGILSRGINGTYTVECLALIAWNNRHLCRGRVALIGGTAGTYTVEYSHMSK